MAVRRLVLDVLKPHQPSIIQLTKKVSDIDGVDGVNSSLIEVDEEVKNVKITIEGEFDAKDVENVVKQNSASIHSVDEVAVGDELVDKINTPQD